MKIVRVTTTDPRCARLKGKIVTIWRGWSRHLLFARAVVTDNGCAVPCEDSLPKQVWRTLTLR